MRIAASQIGRTWRREPWMCVMFACVLLVILSSLISSPQPAGESVPEEVRADDNLRTMNEWRQISEKMVADLRRNETTVRMASLAFAGILIAGLWLNLFLWILYRDGYFRTRRLSPEGMPWVLSDIVRVFTVLFFSEIVLSLFWALGELFSGSAGENRSILMPVTFLRNIAAAVYIFRLVGVRYRQKWDALGLVSGNLPGQAGKGFLAYVGFIPIYLVVASTVMAVAGWLEVQTPAQEVATIFYREEEPLWILFFVFFVAAAGPFFEEIFFRGFIYRILRDRLGFLRAAALLSLVFAALHGHWVGFFPIFALSFSLCAVYEGTGSLASCITFHMIHNLIALGGLSAIKSYAL